MDREQFFRDFNNGLRRIGRITTLLVVPFAFSSPTGAFALVLAYVLWKKDLL